MPNAAYVEKTATKTAGQTAPRPAQTIATNMSAAKIFGTRIRIMHLAHHEIGDDGHHERIRPAETVRVDTQRDKEHRRHRDDVAAGWDREALEIAVDIIRIHIEAREAPHAAACKKDRDDAAEDAEIFQAKLIREERRRDAERAEVAKRIHFLAELARDAEKTRRAPVKAIRDKRAKNEDRRKQKIMMQRRKHRAHAEHEIRRRAHIRDDSPIIHSIDSPFSVSLMRPSTVLPPVTFCPGRTSTSTSDTGIVTSRHEPKRIMP